LCFYENYQYHPARDSYFGAGQENLNMLIFCDQSEFGKTHGGMRRSLYDNNVIDYLTGTGELPDNYVISYYNPSAENAEVHIKRVKSFLPPSGQVGIISITDKQFGSMELFTEKKERKAPIEYTQLELF
jgi:hypothetical protein